MKKIKKQAKNIVTALLLMISFTNLTAQTSDDTVKTGKPNDPMVIKPAKPNDDMSLKPGKTNDANVVMTDTGFINKNIKDNVMEIQLSKIGATKGTGPQIKRVANAMIADHTAILNDLEKFAATKHLSLGSSDAVPTLPQASMKASKDFNKIWASQMLTMHDAKIAELENFLDVTRDAQLKMLVSKALAKIKMHQKMLKQIPGASPAAGSMVI